MEKTIRVLYKPAGKPFEVREIPNTLEACQELVGGYIEVVKICTDCLLVCNEEGLIRDLPVNRFMDSCEFEYDLCFSCRKKLTDWIEGKDAELHEIHVPISQKGESDENTEL